MIINKKDTVSINEIDNEGIDHLIVPRGKNSVLKFSDGTIVHVNAGSQLVYPNTFSNNKRHAYLVGEAFFEVIHNAEMPFVVSTGKLEIEDLGTKFNVSAYPSEAVIETFLVEGKI